MEVHPDKIVCSFDGQRMDPLDRAYADEKFQEELGKRQTKYPAKFAPLGDVSEFKLAHRGSLGLEVSKGVIAVRNVTVTRIRNKD